MKKIVLAMTILSTFGCTPEAEKPADIDGYLEDLEDTADANNRKLAEDCGLNIKRSPDGSFSFDPPATPEQQACFDSEVSSPGVD